MYSEVDNRINWIFSSSRYFQDYPYLYAHAGDLTVSDVEGLLSCYKRLVLQYISLSKGIGVRTETHHASEPVKQLVERKDLPKNADNEEPNQVSIVETRLSIEPIEESTHLSKRAEISEREVVDSSKGDTNPENNTDDLVTGIVVSRKSEDV
jgi:Rab5 GDP/GTP exchange factor